MMLGCRGDWQETIKSSKFSEQLSGYEFPDLNFGILTHGILDTH